MRRTVVLILAVLILAAAGFMASRYWHEAPVETVAPSQYICPMHPDVIQNEPGTCPICGMALVLAHHDDTAADENNGLPAVRITPVVVNNLNVRTAPVIREKLVREARMPGHVQSYSAAGILDIRTDIVGQVAALHAHTPGQRLTAGAVLLEIAPTDNPQAQPIKILMPQSGEIVEVHAKVGDTVEPGMPLITIRAVGQATVDVDIFQNQALWIRAGDRAELRFRHFPGRVWTGRVEVENVRTNFPSRTYSARLTFPLPEGVAMVDMYGEVRIFGAARQDALTIPLEALIRTEEGERVVLATDDSFKPVRVKSGLESGGRVEIVSGLKEGDQVVVSAQFLLDSESSLRAELQRMSSEAASPAHTGGE